MRDISLIFTSSYMSISQIHFTTASATIRIIIDDINDNKVTFQKKLYKVEISENLPVNGIVASFRVLLSLCYIVIDMKSICRIQESIII